MKEVQFIRVDNAEKLSTKELIKLIKPIQDHVTHKKQENEWDDYNEWNHTIEWFKKIKKQNTELTIFSYLCNNTIVGILCLSNGDEVKECLKKYQLKDNAESSVRLGPFHISKKYRGVGEEWIKKEVIPLCKKRKIKKIFVESSHLLSFSLYSRLGHEVCKYNKKSDNGFFSRTGKVFQINT